MSATDDAALAGGMTQIDAVPGRASKNLEKGRSPIIDRPISLCRCLFSLDEESPGGSYDFESHSNLVSFTKIFPKQYWPLADGRSILRGVATSARRSGQLSRSLWEGPAWPAFLGRHQPLRGHFSNIGIPEVSCVSAFNNTTTDWSAPILASIRWPQDSIPHIHWMISPTKKVEAPASTRRSQKVQRPLRLVSSASHIPND